MIGFFICRSPRPGREWWYRHDVDGGSWQHDDERYSWFKFSSTRVVR